MPYLETAQSWLTQSILLLQARPTTTRITTKYTIKPPTDTSLPPKKPRKQKPNPNTTTATPTDQQPTPTNTTTPQTNDPIRATLTLKTYDPVSGTTLKYRTTKQAEVSRLIQILGRLARPMAGLAEVREEEAGGGEGGDGNGVVAAAVESVVGKVIGQGQDKGQAVGGKKGKKKGKK